MNDQQSTFPTPAERFEQQPTPTVRRHWDGNGWTQPTSAQPEPQQAPDPRLGRTAS